MSDTSTIKRQLTIKTGVVKRLAKEEQSYVTEAQQQEQRIAAFIDAGRDEYDVKQQRTVLEDTQKMIPDCRKRLELALDDLGSFLEGLAEPSITNTPEYSAAKQTLASTQTQLESLPSA